MTVESRVCSKASFCFMNLPTAHLVVTMEALRPKTRGTLAGFLIWKRDFRQCTPRTGVDFINCFCALTPNFCASKKLLKKLGVGVGHKWIEQSLWFAPCTQLLLNQPLGWFVLSFYSNQVNTGLVWYSNGPVFKWSTWQPFEYWTPILLGVQVFGIQMVTVL